MTATQPVAASRPGPGIIPDRNPFALFMTWEPLKAFVFMFLSFGFGLLFFVSLVALLTTSLALVMTVILAVVGVPLLGVSALFWMFMGHLERQRIQLFTSIELSNPYRPRATGGFGEQIRSFFRDGALWRDLLYLTLLFPIGLAQFLYAVVGLTIPLSMMAIPRSRYRSGWRTRSAGRGCAWRICLSPSSPLAEIQVQRGKPDATHG
jgi:hypothetical protein